MLNFQRNPFNHTFNDYSMVEIMQIPASGTYEIQLTHRPILKSPNVTVLSNFDTGTGYTEVFNTDSPASNQFVVDYYPQGSETTEGTGRILFNSANAGEWVIVFYKAIGNINLEQDVREDQSEILHYQLDTYYSAPDWLARIGLKAFWNTLDLTMYYVFIIDSSKDIYIFYVSDYNTLKATAAATTLPNSGYTCTMGYTNRSVIWINNSGYICLMVDDATPAKINRNGDQPLTTAGFTSGWNDLSLTRDYIQYITSCRVGDWIYIFGTNATHNTPSSGAIRINEAGNTIEAITSLPNNWQYGTSIYKDGKIYLINNRLSGQEGQCLEYDVYTDTYSILGTLSNTALETFNEGAVWEKNTNYCILPIYDGTQPNANAVIRVNIDDVIEAIYPYQIKNNSDGQGIEAHNYMPLGEDAITVNAASNSPACDNQSITYLADPHKYKNYNIHKNNIYAPYSFLDAGTYIDSGVTCIIDTAPKYDQLIFSYRNRP